MKVIPPLLITDSVFNSSSIAEPSAGEVVWVAATNYTVGEEVIRVETHKVYKNLIGGSDSGVPESTPNRWLEVGYTNRWRMFDLYRNTQSTSATSPLTTSLVLSQRVNSLALSGMVADSVTITMTVASDVVYTKTVNLLQRDTQNYTDYFFGEFGYNPSVVLTDLPPFTGATVSLTFTKSGGDIKVGGVVVGTFVDLGDTELNAESDVINFSKIERDSFGGATLVPRRSIPKTNQSCLLDKNKVNKVRLVREDLNAVPAVWFGVDDDTDGYFDALFIVGIYKSFTINMAHPDHAIVSLEIEEI